MCYLYESGEKGVALFLCCVNTYSPGRKSDVKSLSSDMVKM